MISSPRAPPRDRVALMVRRILLIAVVIVLGGLPGFFFVFNAVFADSSGQIGERAVTFLLVAGSYFALGFVMGLVEPREGWRWGLWWSLVAILILVLYTQREPQQALLHLAYLVAALGPGIGGALLGARRRGRRDPEPLEMG